MLRIKSNINQELKLEEKRQGGAMSRLAHRLRARVHAADLYPGKVSASLTSCLLRQMEKLWVQPAHRGAERGTYPSPCSGSTLEPGKQAPISSGSIQWPDTRASV